MDSKDAVIRDLNAVLLRAAKYGIEPSWSSRAWLLGWGLGLLLGGVLGMIVPVFLNYVILR